MIFSLNHGSFKSILFCFLIHGDYSDFFLLFFIVYFHKKFLSKIIFCMILIFLKIYWDLFYGSVCGLLVTISAYCSSFLYFLYLFFLSSTNWQEHWNLQLYLWAYLVSILVPLVFTSCIFKIYFWVHINVRFLCHLDKLTPFSLYNVFLYS